jgi:hypothetical protein
VNVDVPRKAIRRADIFLQARRVRFAGSASSVSSLGALLPDLELKQPRRAAAPRSASVLLVQKDGPAISSEKARLGISVALVKD